MKQEASLATKQNTTVQAMQARHEYIQTAKVTIKGDVATVKSEHSNGKYAVLIDRILQIATDCECGDRQKRHRVCKHMEAAERKLQTPKKSHKESPLVAIYAAKFAGKTVDVIDGRLQVVSPVEAVQDDVLPEEEEQLFQEIDNLPIVVQDEMMVEGDRDLPEDERRYIVPVAPVVIDNGDGLSIWEKAPLNGNRSFRDIFLR